MSQVEHASIAQVKADFASGRPNGNTVSLVRNLLQSSISVVRPPTYRPASGSSNKKSSRVYTAARTTISTTERTTVSKNEDRSITATQKRNLATELATLGSKILAEKGLWNRKPSRNDSVRHNPRQALQPRSGNTTPSPKKQLDTVAAVDKASAKSEDATDDDNIQSAAQCTHLALIHLRLVATVATRRRLLEGSLAFCRHLLAHGLVELAFVELDACKNLLYAQKGSAGCPEDFRRLGTVLPLPDIGHKQTTDPEVSRLAVIYQTLAVKAIALKHDPRMIEDLAANLCAAASAPSVTIDNFMTLTQQGDKAAIYLETIAVELLSLCPKLSTSADVQALDSSTCASPIAIFRLQIYALQLRRRRWILAEHQIDIKRSLCTQFTKTLRAYVRRTKAQADRVEIIQAAEAGYRLVFDCTHERIPADYEVFSKLYALAASTETYATAQRWIPYMIKSCDAFPETDCRKLATRAARLCHQLKTPQLEALDTFATQLTTKLEGQPEHYEFLVSQLAQLLQVHHSNPEITSSTSYRALARSALRISCWTADTYPDLESGSQRSIISSALRFCSRADLASWIDHRAMLSFVRGGVVTTLSQVARTRSLRCAYMYSAQTMALGELVDVLLLNQLNDVATGADKISHIELAQLEPFEEALLWEWKLKACVKYGPTSSNQTAARDVCKNILCKLDKLYDPVIHPLRRSLVCIQTSLAVSKGLVSASDVEKWKAASLRQDNIGHDAGLDKYIPDIMACLGTTSFLRDAGSPSEARAILHAWDKILRDPEGAENIDGVVYDKIMLASLLESMVSICGALGLQEECLYGSQLQITLYKLGAMYPPRQVETLLSVGDCSALYGRPLHALRIAQEAFGLATETSHSLDRLRSLLVTARAHFVLQQNIECKAALYAADAIQTTLNCQTGSGKREAALLCAKAWWLHSEICLSEGDLSQAMTAVRFATSIVNSVWRQLEERSAKKTVSAITTDSDGLAETDLPGAISKLRLTTTSSSGETSRRSNQGPAFWNVIPLACSILLHAANVYAHTGLFTEAHLYSSRAVAIADSIPLSTWTTTTRSFMANILTLAGRVDDAELCLAKLDHAVSIEPHLSVVELHRARGRICAKTDELEQAVVHYDTACKTMISIGARLTEKSICTTGSANLHSPEAALSTSRKRSATARAFKDSVKARAPGAEPDADWDGGSIMQRRMFNDIKVERAHAELRLLGRSDSLELACETESSNARQLRHLQLMSSFETMAQTDVVFNALVESSLICPGAQGCQQEFSAESGALHKPAATGQHPSKARCKNQKPPPPIPCRPNALGDILQAAQDCLYRPKMTVRQCDAMFDIHNECNMLTTSSIFSLATSLSSIETSSTLNISANMNLPASIAKLREKTALAIDLSNDHKPDQLTWPYPKDGASSGSFESVAPLSAISDILPESWTVVSLHLNADATELVAMRQRKDEAAFLVRLPFARQDVQAEGSESFDFAAGKAELADIIEQSNSICHAGNVTSRKMASAAWWRERESLDKRLHELLVNIEEIWFGGFKGILCPVQKHQLDLSCFRKSFDAILERHLPKSKGRRPAHDVCLPDTTLQLFLDLCHGQSSILDIDVSVLDLLYSIIDTFRFHGRELAYDEIDFDGLVVEIIQAIQAYHDRVAREPRNDRHLILVLEKRLQKFPWESLPYLDNTSVSRIGDMLSLRERIVSMASNEHGLVGGRHHIDCASGTVILDPAADMQRTQETMKPALQSLLSQQSGWQSMTSKAPSEDEFQDALRSSNITLYFGHGGASQYIRTRTVKKLNKCSEIVWLMGCSSGTVTEHDELEATSIPASYLLAGASRSGNLNEQTQTQCLAVVANLWDVTDKDIDRFSLATGEDWGLWSLPAVEKKQNDKSASRGARRDPLSTPPVSPKTPKATKSFKVDAVSKTPCRKGSGQGESRSISLSEAVSLSRGACYLRYLNGAAPVVYGVPVYLDQG